MKKLMKFMGMLCVAMLLLVGMSKPANAMPLDIVEAGTYTFHPSMGPSDAVMTVTDGPDDNDVLVIDKAGNSEDSCFSIDQEGNGGFFCIRVAHTGDYLDADGIKLGKGLVQVTTSEFIRGKKSQLWYARKQQDGTYAIFSAISTKDKHYTLRYTNGKVVIMDEFNVGKNWFWRLNNIAD